MQAVPTTTISILGGSTTDTWDDTYDGTTVSASGVLASILEQRQLVTTAADSRAQVVRFYTGRVGPEVAITTANRIRDEVTGDIYVIDNVSRLGNPFAPQDVRLDLRRAT
jgi:hypothetical protein